MPEMNLLQAVNDALRVEMRRDPRVVVLGEDVGNFGGVFRATEGSAGRVRPRSLHRHAAGGVRDRRHRHRHGPLRHAPGPRDSVRRLHLSGLRSDRERAGQAPVPLGRRVPGAGRHPHADRRRHQGRALPLAVARGAVHARPGAEGGLPVEPGRRQGAAGQRHPRRRPGHLHGAQAVLPRGPRRRAGGRVHHPARASQGRARRGEQVTVLAWWAMVHTALEAAEKGARRATTSRSSTCGRWCRSTRRPSWRRSRRRAGW